VILIETGLAFYFIPDSKTVTAQFRENIKKELIDEFDGDEDLLGEKGNEEDVEIIEKDLGKYDITIHDSKSGTTYAVDCMVVCTIDKDDDKTFVEMYKDNQYRVREQVMIQFREAKIEDLAERQLGLIKKSISKNINNLFDGKILREVHLPAFNYYAQ
ncbi:MAG: hypothetical protein VX111_10970, partial [Planctomycetota bacterium]|nr:hypothetical protein [Planctomycetota bacterium]